MYDGKDKKCDGKGISTWSNSDVYKGKWKNNKILIPKFEKVLTIGEASSRTARLMQRG